MQEVLAVLKSDTSKSNGKGGQHPLQLLGTRESADAYDLRGFLRRSGVPFEWIELTTDTEAQETITNNQTGEQQVVKTHWLFLCLGDVPHTEWAGADGIVRDEQNYLGNSA